MFASQNVKPQYFNGMSLNSSCNSKLNPLEGASQQQCQTAEDYGLWTADHSNCFKVKTVKLLLTE